MRRIHFGLALFTAAVAACSGTSSSNNNNNGGGDGGGPGSTGPGNSADGGNTTGNTGDGGTIGNTGDGGGATNEDGGGTGTDSGGFVLPPFDGGQVSTVYPAPHPAWPTEVFFGDQVLATPDVLTVTFGSDSMASSLEAFGAQATVSSNTYWNTIRSGYCETGVSDTTCVGNGAAGTSKALTGVTLAASYTDSAQGGPSTLQTFIQSLIGSGTNKIGTIGANTLPVFYFPQTTSITLDGAPSCANGGFGGYHNSMTTTAGGSTTFAYAIVMECTTTAGTTPTTLQETTIAASHEIIEAATDPYSTSTTLGWYLNENDVTFIPWAGIGYGEVGDNCVDFTGYNQDEYTYTSGANSFTVQRIWSNAAAAAGGDPCVPAQQGGKPYFNVAAEQWLVTEAVGATTVFDGDAFSDMAVTGGWYVTGYDMNATMASIDPYLAMEINGVSSDVTPYTVQVNNGQKVQVAVTLQQDPGALVQQAGGAIGLLFSFNTANPQSATAGAVWPFLVQSPADAIDSGLTGLDASEDMPSHGHPRIHLTKTQLEQAWKNLKARYN
jgi:hypothetical protein